MKNLVGVAAAIAQYKQRGRVLCGGASQGDAQFKGPPPPQLFFFHTAIIHLSAEHRDKTGNPGV